MKKLQYVKTSLLLCLCILWSTLAFAGDFRLADEDGVPDRFIVTLEDHAARKADQVGDLDLPSVAEVAGDLARMYDGRLDEVFEHALRAFVVEMPEQAARALAHHPAIKAVEQDSWMSIVSSTPHCYYTTSHPTQNLGFPTSPQTINCSAPSPQAGANCSGNWGLDRIDQTSVYRDSRFYFSDTGQGVHVYLLDTGIRATHSEFKDASGVSRVGNGRNTYEENDTDLDDCVGHGTHTAGILAGKTYGVAKNAIIHPVKVITPFCDGRGRETDIVDGIDWIAANHQNPAVASISMNGTGWPTSTALRDAVNGLISKGVTFVQSAGNFNDDACNYTIENQVSAAIIAGGSDENDGRWRADNGDEGYDPNCENGPFKECGSNFGSCVDLFAPAAHIVSASHLSDYGYCRLPGTSMAAPHVAGVAALYLGNAGAQNPTKVANRLTNYALSNVLQTSGRYEIGAGSPNLLLNMDTVDSWIHADACFTGSCSGTTCSLDASCSAVDPDTFVWRYSWTFGDGTTALTNSPTIDHTYPAKDTYTTTLKLVVWSGEEPEESRCVNTLNIGVAGCIQ